MVGLHISSSVNSVTMSSGGGRWQEGRRGSGSLTGGAVGFDSGTSIVGQTCGLKRRASTFHSATGAGENYVANSSSSSDEDFETAPRTLVGTEQGGQHPAIANNAPNGQPRAGDAINNKIKRLGHWLVSHFYPEDMSLHFPSRSKISIMRDIVAAVFELLCGTVTITERDSQVGNPLLSEWREELRQPKGKVTATTICNELPTHNNGGIWFKRHFTVEVVSTLVESEHNGYVNHKIVHMFDDTNGIAKLDWCGYLLKCLVSSHEDWTTFRRLKYTGLILFLMLRCGDRSGLDFHICALDFHISCELQPSWIVVKVRRLHASFYLQPSSTAMEVRRVRSSHDEEKMMHTTS
nr:uncharacterized protein LOC109155364 [Ipomoea batatas]